MNTLSSSFGVLLATTLVVTAHDANASWWSDWVAQNNRDVVLVGAGDIAACYSPGDEYTAELLDYIDGTVFTVGDNAYPVGSDADFWRCYHPSWGRHKARTQPAPGNHEYATPGATGYFNYFGAAAGSADKGYYSYDLGEWHIVVINSMLAQSNPGPQEDWLNADLAANPRPCTLAYWHHPRFSSGTHGNQTQMQPIWEILYRHNADVVVSGHDHSYERFAPQTPTGAADPVRGIRQFVVGTGGAFLYPFKSQQPNSEKRYNKGFGVIKLTLMPGNYRWDFVTFPGVSSDSGNGKCH